MKQKTYLFTNEIVFRGHPDKVCDQISMALLQEYLSKDPNTRAGIEVVGGKGKIFITGEVTSKAKISIKQVVERTLNDIGYDAARYKIINNLSKQSEDIALGVDSGGAGDNGMVFGYACDDTPELLPTAMVILQEFAKQYDRLRKVDDMFLPDGKAQITGLYNKHGKLLSIKTFTICYQNCELCRHITDEKLMQLAENIAFQYDISIEKFLINPTGKFAIGGFDADAGLTGRKIVVDAYQSFANVGGGSMNGKDFTKVDFSGAHFARQLAKTVLIVHKLKWCEVQLGFAIGCTNALSIRINSNKGVIYTPFVVTIHEILEYAKHNLTNLTELAKFGHFTK